MSNERYAVVIVGSGPAGISAAARAARTGLTHVLLEKSDHFSDTIYKYQKGKFVMSTPDALPLRAEVPFNAGRREEILDAWQRQLTTLGVNTRFESTVTSIVGERNSFRVGLSGGDEVLAQNVVLAIGLQGNLRTLNVPGGDWSRIQYQLDDPDEYSDESIVVVGAGDSAIENVIALSEHNRLVIVNRRDEFARAKHGNHAAINAAIASGAVECYFNSTPIRVEPGKIFLRTLHGEAEVPCDRIIARLGAIPPRGFLESCGVRFPSDDRTALPEVSPHYESSVPGLYIVGALIGSPLIKNAINQGFEAVEHLRGKPVPPADEPMLQAKLTSLGDTAVEQFLARIRGTIPIFSRLGVLQVRELVLESEVRVVEPDEVVFSRNEYSNTFFSILEGAVRVELDPEDPTRCVVLREGEYFGEMGLISGRRRSATVVAHERVVLIETNRRAMLRLINSADTVKREMDRTALGRQLQTYLASGLSLSDLRGLIETAEIRSWKAGETLFEEGDMGDHLHLVRRGSLIVSRRAEGRETVLAYVSAGRYVGEMALLRDAPRSATVRAAVNDTETACLEGKAFRALVDREPRLRAAVEQLIRDRVEQNVSMEARPEVGKMVQFLTQHGAGEATDMLLIDQVLCVGCNNCEKACAETHDGACRLDREAGPTFARLHIPTTCRHCEHPHCMKDCPPDAIHRSLAGEVFIDESCIGCGNCEKNCPYGVIHMAPAASDPPRGLLAWLLFGEKRAPESTAGPGGDARKVAVKCDMCRDLDGGPACVRACPTGAALRVTPERFLSLSRPVG